MPKNQPNPLNKLTKQQLVARCQDLSLVLQAATDIEKLGSKEYLDELERANEALRQSVSQTAEAANMWKSSYYKLQERAASMRAAADDIKELLHVTLAVFKLDNKLGKFKAKKTKEVAQLICKKLVQADGKINPTIFSTLPVPKMMQILKDIVQDSTPGNWKLPVKAPTSLQELYHFDDMIKKSKEKDKSIRTAIDKFEEAVRSNRMTPKMFDHKKKD
jgi:hypothetical protein